MALLFFRSSACTFLPDSSLHCCRKPAFIFRVGLLFVCEMLDFQVEHNSENGLTRSTNNYSKHVGVLTSWFQMRSLKQVEIKVKHVTNSPNHNVEDV